MAAGGTRWWRGHGPALDDVGARLAPGGDLRAAVVRVSLAGAWTGALVIAVWATRNYLLGGWFGEDSHAYWIAGRSSHPYAVRPGMPDAFLYSPLFAQLMRAVAWLPWAAFSALFATVSAAAFWWLARPLPWSWRGPVLLICWTEVLTGNISAFLAVALVIGVTRGQALALPVFTKVTPGAVGLLWHLARFDWKQLWQAALTCFVMLAGSCALSPHLWVEWVRFLAHHQGSGDSDLRVRVLAALLLAAYAARSERPVLLAVAFWLAMPMGGFLRVQPMSVLVAAVRLSGRIGGHGAPSLSADRDTTMSA